MRKYEFIVPCHFGLEAVLKREIIDLGYDVTSVEDGRVTFFGDEEALARANIGLRTAERILIKLGSFKAETFEELFQGTKALPIEEWIPKDGRFWVAKAASVKSALFSPSDIQSIMKKAISYLLIFIGIQIVCGGIVEQVWKLITGISDITTERLITVTAVTSMITIVVFLLTRWAEVSPRWLRTRSWGVLCWSVVASLGAIIPSAWIQELMPDLPNLVEQEFDMILQNRWGYLSIGLLAPLSEEIVFRGAILKSLLKNSSLPVWGSIALSAFLFALIHMNPAQMPHAFVIGLLLGWMYQRTGSILPGMAYHWANNSAAYALYNIYPNPDIKLIDIFGDATHVWLAVGFSLLILLPALFQLHIRMKQAE